MVVLKGLNLMITYHIIKYNLIHSNIMTKEQLELVVKISNDRMNHFRLSISEGSGNDIEYFKINDGEVFHNDNVVLSKEQISKINSDGMPFSMGMNNLRLGYYTYRKNIIESVEPVNKDEIQILDLINRSLTLT
jgi:hypothetical protein